MVSYSYSGTRGTFRHQIKFFNVENTQLFNNVYISISHVLTAANIFGCWFISVLAVASTICNETVNVSLEICSIYLQMHMNEIYLIR